jgi:hypothetical protein
MAPYISCSCLVFSHVLFVGIVCLFVRSFVHSFVRVFVIKFMGMLMVIHHNEMWARLILLKTSQNFFAHNPVFFSDKCVSFSVHTCTHAQSLADVPYSCR